MISQMININKFKLGEEDSYVTEESILYGKKTFNITTEEKIIRIFDVVDRSVMVTVIEGNRHKMGSPNSMQDFLVPLHERGTLTSIEKTHTHSESMVLGHHSCESEYVKTIDTNNETTTTSTIKIRERQNDLDSIKNLKLEFKDNVITSYDMAFNNYFVDIDYYKDLPSYVDGQKTSPSHSFNCFLNVIEQLKDVFATEKTSNEPVYLKNAFEVGAKKIEEVMTELVDDAQTDKTDNVESRSDEKTEKINCSNDTDDKTEHMTDTTNDYDKKTDDKEAQMSIYDYIDDVE